MTWSGATASAAGFAGEFADAINLQWRRTIAFAKGRAFSSIEYVIGAERYKPRIMRLTGLCKISYRDTVHTEGLLGLVFAQRHVVECGGVNDPVGLRVADRSSNGIAPRHIELCSCRRNDVMTRIIGNKL